MKETPGDGEEGSVRAGNTGELRGEKPSKDTVCVASPFVAEVNENGENIHEMCICFLAVSQSKLGYIY